MLYSLCIHILGRLKDYGDGGVVVDNNGNVYVTGNSKGIGTSADYATIKYSNLVGVNDEVSNIPTGFALGQNYPNPFNPSTKISYSLPKAGFVRLIIYDMVGREVKTLVNEFKNSGSYTIDFSINDFSSRIYLYRLEAGDFRASKKMILLR